MPDAWALDVLTLSGAAIAVAIAVTIIKAVW